MIVRTFGAGQGIERNFRLGTGLILFAFAASHFTSHAMGLFRLATMDQVGRNVLLWPWQTWPGRTALLLAFIIHGNLGLRALYRRRHLRIPANETWQLVLGLCIPLLILPHAVNVRVGKGVFGLDDSYYRILYQYWMASPRIGLARQLILLFCVWIHGCLGIHFLLRYRPFYQRHRLYFIVAASFLPFLSILGLWNAGWDTAMQSAADPVFAQQHGPPPAGTPNALALDAIESIWQILQLAYITIVGTIIAMRLSRNLRERDLALRITYPGGRVVQVPRGFSVLEASRWARIPHASICGGRGRCSTCRIRIVGSADDLPPIGDAERETLDRIAAPSSVRLACQLRPMHDLAVVPLLPATLPVESMSAAAHESQERDVTALYIDLRGSTDLAAGRLPFDALFIIERYVDRVTSAVQSHGGYVTSVAGDGIMSVFGIAGEKPGAGAENAMHAAIAIWASIDKLSLELHAELAHPLRFGIGIHSGVAAVGTVIAQGRSSVMFLGDTGNVAARLEGLTKELGCTLIISDATLVQAGREAPTLDLKEVLLRGREEQPLQVLLLREPEEAHDFIAMPELIATSGPDRPGG